MQVTARGLDHPNPGHQDSMRERGETSVEGTQRGSGKFSPQLGEAGVTFLHSIQGLGHAPTVPATLSTWSSEARIRLDLGVSGSEPYPLPVYSANLLGEPEAPGSLGKEKPGSWGCLPWGPVPLRYEDTALTPSGLWGEASPVGDGVGEKESGHSSGFHFM